MKSIRQTTLSLLFVVTSGFVAAPIEAQVVTTWTSVAAEAFIAAEIAICQPSHGYSGLYFTRTDTSSSGIRCVAYAAVNIPVGYKPRKLECKVSNAATDASPDRIKISLHKREGGTDSAPVTILNSAGVVDVAPGARWIRVENLSQAVRVYDYEPSFIRVIFEYPSPDTATGDRALQMEFCRVYSASN